MFIAIAAALNLLIGEAIVSNDYLRGTADRQFILEKAAGSAGKQSRRGKFVTSQNRFMVYDRLGKYGPLLFSTMRFQIGDFNFLERTGLYSLKKRKQVYEYIFGG